MSGGGLDGFRLAMMQNAADAAVNTLKSANPSPGRSVYVLIVMADGPEAGKAFSHSSMNNHVAHAFADAFEHEADTIRENAKRGLLTGELMRDAKGQGIRGGG